MVENILRMQGVDGGFHTGYDHYGTYNGTMENAETTSTVILAFTRIQPWPFAWLVVVGLITWLAIAAILVVTIVIRDSRRKKALTNPEQEVGKKTPYLI